MEGDEPHYVEPRRGDAHDACGHSFAEAFADFVFVRNRKRSEDRMAVGGKQREGHHRCNAAYKNEHGGARGADSLPAHLRKGTHADHADLIRKAHQPDDSNSSDQQSENQIAQHRVAKQQPDGDGVERGNSPCWREEDHEERTEGAAQAQCVGIEDGGVPKPHGAQHRKRRDGRRPARRSAELHEQQKEEQCRTGAGKSGAKILQHPRGPVEVRDAPEQLVEGEAQQRHAEDFVAVVVPLKEGLVHGLQRGRLVQRVDLEGPLLRDRNDQREARVHIPTPRPMVGKQHQQQQRCEKNGRRDEGLFPCFLRCELFLRGLCSAHDGISDHAASWRHR